METKFQTSFIPKQPINEPVRRSSGSGIIFLTAFIIFIASVAGAGGVFLYKQYVEKQTAFNEEQLKKNENAFDTATIQELTRLNDRLFVVDTLLKQHIAASNIFGVLSSATLKSVRYNDFTYTNGGDGKVSISMRGQATTYETVALQSKALTDPTLRNVFKSAIFGDLNLDQSGNVSFSFSAGLDPLLISYYKTVRDSASAGVPAPETQVQAPAPGTTFGGPAATSGVSNNRTR